jgi:hypothetical protein
LLSHSRSDTARCCSTVGCPLGQREANLTAVIPNAPASGGLDTRNVASNPPAGITPTAAAGVRPPPG